MVRSRVDQGSLHRAIRELERRAHRQIDVKKISEDAIKYGARVSPKYTGNLSRSWSVEVESQSKVGIANAAPYFDYVDTKYGLVDRVRRFINRAFSRHV